MNEIMHHGIKEDPEPHVRDQRAEGGSNPQGQEKDKTVCLSALCRSLEDWSFPFFPKVPGKALL
ncbi:MAG: hypothetical protein GXY80_07670 [Syntrophorhabdus aromaticivorans]|uniref:Uncharacterized protein n=1 Tax=Syntrophorhabdus aromaticivorans TaxID=328301 RepID=A0A971S1B7_9BACT|nr:hypothetical protein [Syntrophorhabdus aromaticivorans]